MALQTYRHSLLLLAVIRKYQRDKRTKKFALIIFTSSRYVKFCESKSKAFGGSGTETFRWKNLLSYLYNLFVTVTIT